MGKAIFMKSRRVRGLLNSLLAMKESNITLRQVPNLVREWRLWFQITRNLRELEGSWWGVLRRYLSIFRGQPRRKDL